MLVTVGNFEVQVTRRSGYPAEKTARRTCAERTERPLAVEREPYRCYLASGIIR